MEWWKIILGVYIVGQLWIIYEFITAPTMPEDYDLSIEEKEILKDIQSRNDDDRDTKDN
jgi:hypothetical protein